MTVQNIIRNLREKHGLSQDQLAGRVMVTRQAVSRWETGPPSESAFCSVQRSAHRSAGCPDN